MGIAAFCRKGIHRMVGENVMTVKGGTRCRECWRLSNKRNARLARIREDIQGVDMKSMPDVVALMNRVTEDFNAKGEALDKLRADVAKRHLRDSRRIALTESQYVELKETKDKVQAAFMKLLKEMPQSEWDKMPSVLDNPTDKAETKTAEEEKPVKSDRLVF
jgi:hypothetical protein